MLNLQNIPYNKLTSVERFNLAVAALSRNDQDELSRLKRTCPIKHYSMIDCEYVNRFDALIWVTTQFSDICEYSYNKIVLCDSCITVFATLCTPMQKGINNNVLELTNNFANAKLQHISNLNSAFTALNEFCSENKINYNHVLEWMKKSPEMFYQYDAYLNNNIKVSSEFVMYVKQNLYSIWRRHVSE
jgi:hypothetical protein